LTLSICYHGNELELVWKSVRVGVLPWFN